MVAAMSYGDYQRAAKRDEVGTAIIALAKSVIRDAMDSGKDELTQGEQMRLGLAEWAIENSYLLEHS